MNLKAAFFAALDPAVPPLIHRTCNTCGERFSIDLDLVPRGVRIDPPETWRCAQCRERRPC